MRPDEGTLRDVLFLLNADIKQPIGHELLTEAWYLMTRHQRLASMVMSVAAAEVEFKELVAALVPDASWLVGNVPTPPLERMIKEYLPTLPAKENIQGKIFVPSIILEPIKKAVVIRNSISHAGKTDVKHDTLTTTLTAVRDFLYFLDFYSGLAGR